MSQANVDRVRRGIEAFNRGDVSTALEGMHPEVVWRTLDQLPDAGTYRGHEGVRNFWQTWRETFRGFQLLIDDYEAVGDRHVLASFRVSGEGTESGARVESPPFFQLFEIRDEQLVSASMFTSRAEALGAAGLSQSQENVELMTRALQALNARDDRAVEALTTDETEWRPALTAGGHLERTVYRGKRGMTDYRDDLDRALGEWSFHIEAVEPVERNHVLYRGRFTGRSKVSGVPLDSAIWGLWRIEGGKFIRGVGYLTEAEALEAAERLK
jgi:ketosteroid isomerase-like protein